jgi:hypothetical protein
MPFKHKVRTKKAPFLRKKPVLVGLVALLVTAGVVGALELTGVIDVFKSKPEGLATQATTPNRTGGSETKGSNGNANSNGTDDKDTAKPEDDKSSAGSIDPSTPLKEPSGNFVSNHHPNLSGSPSPNEIQSTCVTTSGATCTIVFTKGSETKQLPVQNTDLEGAAYWSWKLNDIGLSAGTWKVQAKAALGSQTKTTSDALDLEVKP